MFGRIVIGTLLFISSVELRATASQVIYGEDNRMEVFEASPQIQSWARSVATMIPNAKLRMNANSWSADQTTFSQWLATQMSAGALGDLSLGSSVNFCPEERFTQQPNPGQCSGFLIAPDLLVTAGHCSLAPDFCEDNSWVFDFQLDGVTKRAGLEILAKDVYRCERIISSALKVEDGQDFALVKLERRVEGRVPLKIRSLDKVANEAPVVVIGSPSGLPLKVASGAKVRNNENLHYFSANLDTYQGNSGSPVFNAVSGVVEGIIVRGEEDFKFNQARSCLESNVCEEEGCMGEEISRMTSIPEIRYKHKIEEAIKTDDLTALEGILVQGIWPDIYGANGVSPLLLATRAGNLRAMKLLVSFGADPKLRDVDGHGALHYWLTSRTRTASSLDFLVSKGVELGAVVFELLKKRDGVGLRIVLRAGAPLQIRNSEGLTPLEYANALNFAEGSRILRLEGMIRKLSKSRNGRGKRASKIE